MSLGDRARSVPVSARADTTRVTTPVPAQTEASVRQQLGGLALPFIANQGQTDPQVRFYAPTFGGTVFVTTTGEIVYALPGARQDQSKVHALKSVASSQWSVATSGFRVQGSANMGNPRSAIRNPQSVRPQLLLFKHFFPLAMHGGLAGFVDTFVGVRAEEIALRLR